MMGSRFFYSGQQRKSHRGIQYPLRFTTLTVFFLLLFVLMGFQNCSDVPFIGLDGAELASGLEDPPQNPTPDAPSADDINEPNGSGDTQISFNEWQRIPIRTKAQKIAGFSGGEASQMIFDIAFAPSNGDIVYVMVDVSGIWRSIDGGASWDPKVKGFLPKGGSSISVSPVDPNIILVAGSWMNTTNTLTYSWEPHGIWRSANGGESWTNVSSSANFARRSGHKLFAWVDANIVYAGAHNGGLYKSTDTGKTWIKLNLPDINTDEISHVRVHPDNRSIVYVVSKTDNKIYKITGAGTGAVPLAASGITGSINSFVVSGNRDTNFDNDTVYVTIGTTGVYRSINGGQSFSSRSSGLRDMGKQYYWLEMSPADNNYLLTGFTQADRAVFYSHDGGATWHYPSSTDVQNAGGWVAASTIGYNWDSGFEYYNKVPVFHPTDRDIALAHGKVAIKRTTDGGVNWRYSSDGYTGASGWGGVAATKSAWSFDPQNSNRWLVTFTDWGAHLTEDGGSTFRSLTGGSSCTTAGTLIPGMNIAVIAKGAWESRAVYVSRNIDAPIPSWTQASGTTWKSSLAYPYITVHPQNSNVVYADKFRFDNIKTSNLVTTLSRGVEAMFRENGNTVYSFERIDDNNSRIYRSDDMGATWKTTTYANSAIAYPVIPIDQGLPQQIVVHPANRDIIYIAAFGKGLIVVNGGSYSIKSKGLTPNFNGSIEARGLAVDPVNPNIIYLSYAHDLHWAQGTFRSLDGGNTWTDISYNFSPGTESLYINPYNRYVYHLSAFGTWKLPPP